MKPVDSNQIIEQLGLEFFRQLSTFAMISDVALLSLLGQGSIIRLAKGETVNHQDEKAEDFQIVLQGKLAYYKHCDDHDVFTRFFNQGEQIGFDEMTALIGRDGTDVAMGDTLLLSVSCEQFYGLHLEFPSEFGILMINLARELSREISILEDVIVDGTGWLTQQPLPIEGK